MLNLKTIAITIRSHPRVADPMLNQISIAQPELVQVEPERHRQRQPILPNLPTAKRLHPDVQVVWLNLPVRSDLPREPRAHTFINRTADVAPESQRPKNIEIETLRDRRRDLDVVPLLIVCVIDQ